MSAVFCFSVHAEPTPCALPRILEVMTLGGRVPARVHAHLAGSLLVVDLQMDDLATSEAEHLARRLRRILSVGSVLWSQKRSAAA